MKFRYARVSSRGQNLDALTAAGCDRVVTEKVSGNGSAIGKAMFCMLACRQTRKAVHETVFCAASDQLPRKPFLFRNLF